MSDTKTKLKPMADIKFKVREYEGEDGKMHGVWVTVGTLFSSPHGSHMSVKLDTVPVGEFNGWLSVFKRDEFDEIKSADDIATDDADKPGDIQT